MLYNDFIELQGKEPKMNYDILNCKIIANYKLGNFENDLIKEIKKDSFFKKMTFTGLIIEQYNNIYKCLKDNEGNIYEI